MRMLKLFPSSKLKGHNNPLVTLKDVITTRWLNSSVKNVGSFVQKTNLKSNYLEKACGDSRTTSVSSNSQLWSKPKNGFYAIYSPISCYSSIENRYRLIDQTRWFTTSSSSQSSEVVPEELSKRIYEEIAEDTLESLYTYFDEILEKSPTVNGGDVSFSTGVLTIKLGKHGTYVINKQTPNRQIWLSSPTSGPKRYDYINKTWIYKHDGVSLFQLLNSEIPQLLGLTTNEVNFETNCSYGKAAI